MRVVIINGFARAGKDTFCNMVSKYCRSTSYSSVDKVKEIAKMCGWDGVKDEKSRKFLSELKRITTEYNDMSFTAMEEAVADAAYANQDIVFLHIREPEQIEQALERFNEFNPVAILVVNGRVTPVTSNDSDASVLKCTKYTYYIENSGTLDDLDGMAKKFANQILER